MDVEKKLVKELKRKIKSSPRAVRMDMERFSTAGAAGREDIDKGFSGVAPDAELVVVVKLKQSKKYLREFYSMPDEHR